MKHSPSLHYDKSGQILVHHERLRLKRIALEEQKKKEIERQRIVDQTGAVLLLQKHHHVKQKHKKRKARELQEAKEEAARIAKLETQIKEARSRYSLEEELGKRGKRGMVSNFLLEHRYKRNLRKTLPPLVTRRTKLNAFLTFLICCSLTLRGYCSFIIRINGIMCQRCTRSSTPEWAAIEKKRNRNKSCRPIKHNLETNVKNSAKSIVSASIVGSNKVAG